MMAKHYWGSRARSKPKVMNQLRNPSPISNDAFDADCLVCTVFL